MAEETEYVNNSNPAFMTGVMYGLFHATEIIKLDILEGCEGNYLAELINESLEFSRLKIIDILKAIDKNKRVPDMQAMLKAFSEHPSRLEGIKLRKAAINKAWEKLGNENK